MAKFKLFSIHDRKLNTWSAPMQFLHSGQAERAVQEIFQDKNSMLAKYPEDYSVFQVGEFDDDSAQLTPFQPPTHLISISSLLPKQPPLL